MKVYEEMSRVPGGAEIQHRKTTQKYRTADRETVHPLDKCPVRHVITLYVVSGLVLAPSV